MAYGRLDVYWPDGKLESYMLDGETVSIGRAEGNSIALDTDTISRYHFSLMQADGNVSITDLDSANGTYVDGVKLPSNEPLQLGDVEEVQVGSLRIIFRKIDETPTIPSLAVDDDTARIEREDAQYSVHMDAVHLDVWPAASSSAELSITNNADEMRRFAIRVSGMPGEWLRVNRPEVNIMPGDTANVLINIKPPRRPETQPRLHTVSVDVMPMDSPELPANLQLSVQIQAFSGFGIAVAPQIDAGDPLQAFLHNQGSDVLTITLTATDPAKALHFQLPTAPLQLNAGQLMRVNIHARAKNAPLTGSAVTYPIVLQARAHNAAGFLAATSTTVTIAPRLPVWALVSASGIAISIVLLLLLALTGVLNPPDPILENLVVNEERIARGDDLIISWDVQDVESISIDVNGVIVANSLPGDTSSFAIDTDELEGDITITVLGQMRSRSVEDRVAAFVYRPMDIASFTAVPDTLVRHVVTSLTVAWDVPGAVRVELSGLSDFTNARVPDGETYAAQDQVVESGIPETSIELLLFAEDEAGNTLEQPLVIPIVDARCSALEELVVRGGPDEGFQQVGTIPQGTSVVVLAKDAEAGWLRVQLGGDVRGWASQESFLCAENFDLANLRVESNPPVLPPTATPSLTPTPVPLATVRPPGSN